MTWATGAWRFYVAYNSLWPLIWRQEGGTTSYVGAKHDRPSVPPRGPVEDRRLPFGSRGVQRLKGLPTPLEVFALVG